MFKKLLSKIFLSFVFLGFLTLPIFVNAGSAPSTQTLSNPAQQAQIESQLDGNFCKISMFSSSDFNFSMCALSIFYHFILAGSFWIAEIAGKIFDYFIFFALNTESYKSDFINIGWGVVRDIANVAFIFTLLYLAIRHILGNSAKKAIPTLLIVALLINFSLFFTKVVIDAGNILARAFVNSINIENDAYADVVGYKSISVGIVSKINPQNMLSEQLFQPSISGQIATYQTTGDSSEGSSVTNIDSAKGYFFLIFLMLTIVNIALAWVFLSVALLFVGRIIGLWFAMIFAPVAFITLAVPGSGGLVKQMSFDSWKDNLLKLAFMPAIFIFFLYLTIMFMATIFSIDPTVNAGDTAMYMLKTMIPFLFVIFLLNIAKKTATEMAGEMGGMVKSVVGKIAGVGLGLAGGAVLGGTALLGRKVIGAAARSRMKSGNYAERMANAKNPLSRWAIAKEMKAMKYMSEKATFDARNMSKNNLIAKGVGAGTAGLLGEKFKPNFGKATKITAKKEFDEAKKARLQFAEDASKVSDQKKFELEQKKKQDPEYLRNKSDLESIEKSRKEKEERINELKKPGLKTQAQIQELEQLEQEMEQIGSIEKITKSKLEEIDNKYDPGKISTQARESIAKDTESYTWIKGPQYNKEIADSIRKGDKAESDDEKLLNTIKKYMKKEEAKDGKDADKKGSSGGNQQDPQTPPPPPQNPTNNTATDPTNSVDTNKIVDAINKQGELERKRDLASMEGMKNFSASSGQPSFDTQRNPIGFKQGGNPPKEEK